MRCDRTRAKMRSDILKIDCYCASRRQFYHPPFLLHDAPLVPFLSARRRQQSIDWLLLIFLSITAELFGVPRGRPTAIVDSRPHAIACHSSSKQDRRRCSEEETTEAHTFLRILKCHEIKKVQKRILTSLKI